MKRFDVGLKGLEELSESLSAPYIPFGWLYICLKTAYQPGTPVIPRQVRGRVMTEGVTHSRETEESMVLARELYAT
jgi:hypothetical protein